MTLYGADSNSFAKLQKTAANNYLEGHLTNDCKVLKEL